jgi:hypothetical protein
MLRIAQPPSDETIGIRQVAFAAFIVLASILLGAALYLTPYFLVFKGHEHQRLEIRAEWIDLPAK